jgi:hypothetical protein
MTLTIAYRYLPWSTIFGKERGWLGFELFHLRMVPLLDGKAIYQKPVIGDAIGGRSRRSYLTITWGSLTR